MRTKSPPPGPFTIKIGRRIRWLREIQDMGLKEMSERTKMTQQTLARYERADGVGGLSLQLSAIEEIAKALHVSPNRLCGALADFAWLVQEQIAKIESPNALISKDPDVNQSV